MDKPYPACEKYEKLKSLQNDLMSFGNLAVAFSGGVDSSFLLKAAHDVLGDHVLAVTVRSSLTPEREYVEAAAFTAKYGIRHQTIGTDELEIPGFTDNPPDRCFLCKKELFAKIIKAAEEQGIKHVAEGSNHDDISDYRPGMKALELLGIESPLKKAMLRKSEIRQLSKEFGLASWDKPAYACLASRFPYGEKITREKLEMVDKAEQLLMDLGFKHIRVRHHGQVARIEVTDADMTGIMTPETRDMIYSGFRKIGFDYTALDLKGYRTGSMNEVL